jgi:hypothetical protein
MIRALTYGETWNLLRYSEYLGIDIPHGEVSELDGNKRKVLSPVGSSWAFGEVV